MLFEQRNQSANFGFRTKQENFGHKQESNYWQAKKVFWQIIRRVRGAKLLSAGNAAGCDEIRLEVLKSLNREVFFWLTQWLVCVKLPGVLEELRKIGKMAWSSSQYTRRETEESALTTEASLSSASLEKCMVSVLKKYFQQIFEKSWEHARDVCTYFVASTKHKAGFLTKGFGEYCGSALLTAASYWPSNHCIPAQMFVSVSAKLINTVHSRADEGVTVGSARINRLLFAEDLILLSSSEQGLHTFQHILDTRDWFSAACNHTENLLVLEISTKKTEVSFLSRNPR